MPERTPRNVYAFGLTSFFNDTASEMAYWVLPAFLASIGAGPAQLGIIEGIAESVASFAKLLSGQLADRVPRRKAVGRCGLRRGQCREAAARTHQPLGPDSRHSIRRPLLQRHSRHRTRRDGRRVRAQRAHRFCVRLDSGHGLRRRHRRATRWHSRSLRTTATCGRSSGRLPSRARSAC